jgi:hypothetical protein
MESDNLLAPSPSALVESMRSMGYSPGTAVADLIDNSITAGAKTINIELSPEGEEAGWILIEDDGKGLDHEDLRKAMRWGGQGPKTKREISDLGRFGLGLKTASFSMGRRLTVASKRNGTINFAVWDIDEICNSNSWILGEKIYKEDKEKLKNCNIFKSLKEHGTAVLISKLDKIKIDSFSSEQRQVNEKNLFLSIKNYLGLVFHRFIEQGKIQIKIGASEIKPWSLFGYKTSCEHKWIKSTEKLDEGRVLVQSFTLPHPKNLTDEQYKTLAGPSGWNKHQGFFIYRTDRLIVPGTWLGMFKSEEIYKLARISIDLKNESDSSWSLNVIKSKVRPPSYLRADLERIAARSRKSATHSFRWHSEKEAPDTSIEDQKGEYYAFWAKTTSKHETTFHINRNHPLVEALAQNIKSRELVEAFLKSFEKLLPISAILQEPSKSMIGLSKEVTPDEVKIIYQAFQAAVDVLIKEGTNREKACEIILNCSPFCEYKNQIALINANGNT